MSGFNAYHGLKTKLRNQKNKLFELEQKNASKKAILWKKKKIEQIKTQILEWEKKPQNQT